MKTISVIMPVYNDEKHIRRNIRIAIKELTKLDYDFTIMVVNDGSTDGTREAVRGAGVAFISYHTNCGKGAAFLCGASTVKSDYILLADSDMQVRFDELPVFFNIMDMYNADAVVGNKRHPYSEIQYTRARHIISNTYNFICRMMFGIQLRDTQCGFKLFKAEALKKVMPEIKTKRFAFDLEILVSLKENNYRVADAPVYMRKQYNAGSIGLRNIWETFRDTIAIWLRKKEGFYGSGQD